MFSKFANSACYLALFFAMVFPGDFAHLKVALLLIAVFLALFDSFASVAQSFSNSFFFVMLLWYVTVWIGLALSYLNDFEIDSNIISLLCLTPVVALVIANQILRRSTLRYLLLFSFATACSIIAINIAFYLHANELIGDLPDLFIFGAARETDSILEYRVNNQIALMFLAPVLMVYLVVAKPKTILGVFGSIAIVLLLTLVAGFSGRRALQLNLVLSFVIVIVLLIKSFGIRRSLYVGTVLLLSLILFFFYLSDLSQVDLIMNTFLNAFSPGDESFDIKYLQTNKLTGAWLESPVFGLGASAYIRDYIRNEEFPWSYEMVYHAYLFQFGLLGLVVPIIFIATLVRRTFFYLRNGCLEECSFAVGLFLFLIAGFSNPMIYYFWFWVFAFVFISGRFAIE